MLRRMTDQQKIMVATGFCFAFMLAEALTGIIIPTLQPFIVEHYGTSLTENSHFSISGHSLFSALFMRENTLRAG